MEFDVLKEDKNTLGADAEDILFIRLLDNKYAVCRFNSNQSIPSWVWESDLYSITKTYDELSIVCIQKVIPDNIKCEKDWRVFKVEGILDFSLVGILSKISGALAGAGISIFAVSTYDTDYILVKEADVLKAVKTLKDEKIGNIVV